MTTSTPLLVVLPRDQEELAARLRSEHYDVHGVEGVEPAVRSCAEGPAVVVLPSAWLDGPHRLRSLFPTARVRALVLGDASEQEAAAWLESGADDHVAVGTGGAELLARMHCLLRRPFPPAPPVRVTLGQLSLDLAGRSVRVAGRVLALAPQEFTVLEALLTHAPAPVPARVLLDLLRAADRGDELKVIIYRLRGRLRATGCDVVVETLRGFGYVAACEGARG